MKMTFRKPFDAHRHLRDGDVLDAVSHYASQHFYGSIIMPNLVPPVATKAQAQAYQKRIMKSIGDPNFLPMMTLYLTDQTDPDDLETAFEDGVAVAAKLYPLHGTTNSGNAVSDYTKVHHVFKRMEKIGMPLCIHGERPTMQGEPVDHYDREAIFLRSELQELREAYPDMRISLEHISTKEAAEFIAKYGDKDLVATLTPHHLLTDRRYAINNSDNSCMPIIKAREHKEALQALVARGCEWVHLGTDCAPHVEGKKQAVQCACGCFTGPHAIALYLQAFEEADALEYFEAFASLRGPRFFGIEPSDQLVMYAKESWELSEMTRLEGEPYVDGIQLIRPFGYRSPEETAAGLGKNRIMTWKQVA